jgi:N6-L-threonylcarbamoyladenine synthase
MKIILGIETSCDETAAAVGIKQGGRVEILSNVVASSSSMQAKYGGVIPEMAAREQLKAMIPVIKEALAQAQIQPEDLDGIAVTQGPGLIGSLLVGVETAKMLAVAWEIPIIPINHLSGHFFANWIYQYPDPKDSTQQIINNNKTPTFPELIPSLFSCF